MNRQYAEFIPHRASLWCGISSSGAEESTTFPSTAPLLGQADFLRAGTEIQNKTLWKAAFVLSNHMRATTMNSLYF